MATPISAICTSCKKQFVSRNAHRCWKRRDGTWAGNCPGCLSANGVLKTTVAARPPAVESSNLTCPRCWLTGPPRPCCELCGGKVYSWKEAAVAYGEMLNRLALKLIEVKWTQGQLFDK